MVNERATFYIKYDGPALEDNEMDIKELAPSLIAVADLFEEANMILNRGTTKITVSVKGSFKSGSFGIDFSVIQDIYQQVIQFFNRDGIVTAAIILQLLGFDALSISKGLLHLIKKIGKRKIKSIKTDKNEREVSIIVTNDNGALEEIKTPKNVFLLFRNYKIRKAVEQIISDPLSKDGINKFVIVDSDESKSVEIKKADKDLYYAPDIEDELLGETVTNAFLQIVSLSFKKDNKWRFSRGESTFFATLEDKDFLEQIENNEARFSKDDILQVRLRIKEYLTDRGISTEYFIEQVIEHRSASRQLQLPMDNE